MKPAEFNSLSVCLPTYKGLEVLEEALQSILNQSCSNFEVIVGNDSPTDHAEVEKFLERYKDERIKLLKNQVNLGYPENIKNIVRHAQHEILFFMCQDDVLLSPHIFEKTLSVFNTDPEIGVITRPYFWFKNSQETPIRVVDRYHVGVITHDAPEADILKVLETIGQLSGLVMRKSLITSDFNQHIFPCHAAPFLSIMKTHKCYLWPDFMIAVRTTHSQTKLSKIYRPSPTWTWIDMFRNVFPEEKYAHIRRIGIEKMSRNYIGLVQIKNFGYFRDLLADIYCLIAERKKNLLNVKFWFFVLGTILIPKTILRTLVDKYKDSYGRRDASLKVFSQKTGEN